MLRLEEREEGKEGKGTCACVHILILTFVSQEEEGKWREETKETKKVIKRPRIVIVCIITKN